MGSITDRTLPGVRLSLGDSCGLLAAHQQGCEPCRTVAPSRAAWCAEGWQLHGAQRQLRTMIRRMEAIQLEDRQPRLFDDPEES